MSEQPVNIFERLEADEARRQTRRLRIQEWVLVVPYTLIFATLGIYIVKEFPDFLQLAKWLAVSIVTQSLDEIPYSASQALNTYLLAIPFAFPLLLIPHKWLRFAALILPAGLLIVLSVCFVLRCVIDVGALTILWLALLCAIGVAMIAFSIKLYGFQSKKRFARVVFLAANVIVTGVGLLEMHFLPRLYNEAASQRYGVVAARAVLAEPEARGARLIAISTNVSDRRACGLLDFGDREGATPFRFIDGADREHRLVEIFRATPIELEQNPRLAGARQAMIESCQDSGPGFVATRAVPSQ